MTRQMMFELQEWSNTFNIISKIWSVCLVENKSWLGRSKRSVGRWNNL